VLLAPALPRKHACGANLLAGPAILQIAGPSELERAKHTAVEETAPVSVYCGRTYPDARMVINKMPTDSTKEFASVDALFVAFQSRVVAVGQHCIVGNEFCMLFRRCSHMHLVIRRLLLLVKVSWSSRRRTLPWLVSLSKSTKLVDLD